MAKKARRPQAKKDPRKVKPRMGHLDILRVHRVERDPNTYHRASSNRDAFREQDS